MGFQHRLALPIVFLLYYCKGFSSVWCGALSSLVVEASNLVSIKRLDSPQGRQ